MLMLKVFLERSIFSIEDNREKVGTCYDRMQS